MTYDSIRDFETLQGQIESLHEELSNLSKKSPGDALNSFKLGLVNNLLARANAFLGKDRKPIDAFSSFEDEQLPSNSDVLMVTGQYLSAFENLRGDNISVHIGAWYWMVTNRDGGQERSELRTAPPKKITQKK